MDIQEVELLHDLGYMPDWAYYQQNGKSAEENYRIQKQKRRERYNDRKTLEKAYSKRAEEFITETIEELISKLEI